MLATWETSKLCLETPFFSNHLTEKTIHKATLAQSAPTLTSTKSPLNRGGDNKLKGLRTSKTSRLILRSNIVVNTHNYSEIILKNKQQKTGLKSQLCEFNSSRPVFSPIK